MRNILVSACLLGTNCRWDGGHKFSQQVADLKQVFNLIPVCPEFLAGMPTPRAQSEEINGRVIDKEGNDVTDLFVLGSQKCLEIANKNNCKVAILKSGSPSCGVGEVYDGTFTGNKIAGSGITARLLLENGISVYTEKEIGKIK
ncbi:MAG: DUF523 domain-containing protein [Firmicutes bacterium]|nr:DUF523 domain-containing protein [Bacillota bacterium]